MNLFELHVRFVLPEDFKGGLGDALKELLKFHEEEGKHNQNFIEESDESKPDCLPDWESFIKATGEGKRLDGYVYIAHWNGEEWIKQTIEGEGNAQAEIPKT